MRDMELDSSVASADVAWLMMLVFQVLSVIAAGSSATASPDAADAAREGAGSELVVHITASGALELVDTGGLPGPSGAPGPWLHAVCADQGGVVTVTFPDDATHGWCRDRVRELAGATVGCDLMY